MVGESLIMANSVSIQKECFFSSPKISLVFWKNLPSAAHIYLLTIGQFNMKTLNGHNFSMVMAFDLISKLRAWP